MVIGTVRRSERKTPQMRAFFWEVECGKDPEASRRRCCSGRISPLLWQHAAVGEGSLSVARCSEAVVQYKVHYREEISMSGLIGEISGFQLVESLHLFFPYHKILTQFYFPALKFIPQK